MNYQAGGYKVAIVGATGNVGREMLDILAERQFPVSEVVPLASLAPRSARKCRSRQRCSRCKHLDTYDFSDTDICLMSAGGSVSKEWSPKIGAQGCVVIDNSSAWRYDSDVPLIVPEVNADAAAGFRKKNIIANPNCSTAQLVVALKPFARRSHHHARRRLDLPVGVRRRQGRHGRTRSPDKGALFARRRRDKKFPKRIAFNPHSAHRRLHGGRLYQEEEDDGGDEEDLDPKIKLTATVRVPVFISHSEAVNVEFQLTRSPPTRRRRSCAHGPRRARRRQARARRLHDAARGGRRGRDLHFAHPRGRHRGERPRLLVRQRQPPQGRGAESDHQAPCPSAWISTSSLCAGAPGRRVSNICTAGQVRARVRPAPFVPAFAAT